jgi:hypothetical protein
MLENSPAVPIVDSNRSQFSSLRLTSREVARNTALLPPLSRSRWLISPRSSVVRSIVPPRRDSRPAVLLRASCAVLTMALYQCGFGVSIPIVEVATDCFAHADSRVSSRTQLPRVDRVHQIHQLAKSRESLTKVASRWSDTQRRDAHVPVGLDSLAHHLGVAQQICLGHHL